MAAKIGRSKPRNALADASPDGPAWTHVSPGGSLAIEGEEP